MSLMEKLGTHLGRLSAPLFEWVSHARKARTFHPVGVIAFGRLVPVATDGYGPLARAVEGPAFARFSGALWKRERWPDVLGIALGLTAEERSLEAEQHLLFATIRRPWTMPFSPFVTRVHDALANRYFAVSPFDVPGRRRVYLRLAPQKAAVGRPGRTSWRARLAHDVDHRTAVLELQASPRPFVGYRPVARLELSSLAKADPPQLELDPFLDGRGLFPRGFVHALRHGAYAGSRRGRGRADLH